MREQPTGVALLQCARDALKSSVLPLLNGDAKRDVLMVMNAMSIAQREMDMGTKAAELEQQSLSLLLGEPVFDLKEANRQLSIRIRAGEADPGREECKAVLVHLRETGKARLQASNPKVLKAESL